MSTVKVDEYDRVELEDIASEDDAESGVDLHLIRVLLAESAECECPIMGDDGPSHIEHDCDRATSADAQNPTR